MTISGEYDLMIKKDVPVEHPRTGVENMEQTYCSKHCENCAQKEALNCPGCKAGPGRPVMGQCEIARCAQEKGYENCEKYFDGIYQLMNENITAEYSITQTS